MTRVLDIIKDGDNHSETEVTPATQNQGEFTKAAETSQERQNSHPQQMWLGHKNDHMQKQTNKQTNKIIIQCGSMTRMQ